MIAKLDALDQRLTSRIVVARCDASHRRLGVQLLRRFSEAGSYGIGWIVLFAIVGVTSAGWAPGLVAAACVVSMLVINTGIKLIIRRPRPVIRAIDHAPTTYSMPSAHTSMAMVGAACMSVLLPDLTPLWWGVAAALAISRVLLGMHYLGDVIAGAVLGLVLGLLVAAPLCSAYLN